MINRNNYSEILLVVMLYSLFEPYGRIYLPMHDVSRMTSGRTGIIGTVGEGFQSPVPKKQLDIDLKHPPTNVISRQ